MKSTNHFKNTIQAYLEERAASDPQFEWAYTTKENKNIDDCITYILNAVQKSGCNGFADDEIFGMAAHYYDEDDIEVGKPIACKVVVNQTFELSENDIQEAKKEAYERVVAQEMEKHKQKTTPPKPIKAIIPNPQQGSLF